MSLAFVSGLLDVRSLQSVAIISGQPVVDEVDDVQGDEKRPDDAEVNLLPSWVFPLLHECEVSNRDSYDPDGCDDNPISQCHNLYD